MEGPPLPHTRAGIVLSVRAPPGVSSPPVLPQERGTCGPDALLPGVSVPRVAQQGASSALGRALGGDRADDRPMYRAGKLPRVSFPG